MKNKAAQELGKLGGSVKSAAKKLASQANGIKGGRPRTATKYHVVRLDYGIRNSDGNFHQTHHFSTHRTLSAAIKTFLKKQNEFNCVDIVDQAGKKVDFEY